jgi:predicted PurR-regulated permease PerM
VKGWLTTALSKILNSLATILLITVYIFFMLLYRGKFRKAVLKSVPEEQQEKGKQVLSGIIKDARQYLVGNLILVVVLTVIYSIGFSISGMKSPFTTAFLAAVLALIPYVGTLLGGAIAMGLAYITTGQLSTLWIVLGTYLFAQFIESYFIEPYLVGKRVKVNPLFTIFAVIIGGAVWGVIGMIVFLPLFAFIKVVADQVPMLNPLGYTIGNEDTSEGEGAGAKFKKKVKSWFK